MRTIDIGCGGYPTPGVTHAIDGYPDNKERGTDIKIPEGVEFSWQNIEYGTNFDDKFFDYSYCKMVLEHTNIPHNAIQEIMRISKAGLIVVPTWTWEILHGREYHKQLCWLDGDTLVFMRKTPQNYRKNNFDGDALWAKNDSYKAMFDANFDMFTIQYEWEGEIKYRIQEPINIYQAHT